MSVTQQPLADVAVTTGEVPDELARRTANWLTVIFVLEVLLQRFAVPSEQLAMLVPVTLVWIVLAQRKGIMELDLRRALGWVIALAVSGVALVVQTAMLAYPLISSDSWLLFMAVWLPSVMRFTDRRPITYRLALRRVVNIITVLAVTCIFMLASQFVGVGYQDYLRRYIPSTLLLQGFNTTYPIEFGSSIYRSNAWIGLEPSIVSFLLGIGLLAAILIRCPAWQMLIIMAGMFCTFGGSGFMVVLVGVIALLAFPARRLLLRYAAPAGIVLVAVIILPVMQPLLDRASSEFFDTNSSASLRAVQAYISLWPRWTGDMLGMLIGRGAGAAQHNVNYLHIGDALVPTPGRIVFDYGIIAGVVIIAVLLFVYVDGPSASIALTAFFSLWVFQPGGSQIVFALPVMLLVTFFAPHFGPRIEEYDGPPLAKTRRKPRESAWLPLLRVR